MVPGRQLPDDADVTITRFQTDKPFGTFHSFLSVQFTSPNFLNAIMTQQSKDTKTKREKPCYIHDQAVSVLICNDSQQRRNCLDPQLLRQLRRATSFHADSSSGPNPSGELLKEDELERFWCELKDRDQLLSACILASGLVSGDQAEDTPQAISTRRLCIVADAGMGKSKLIEWLLYRLNTPSHSDQKLLALELSLEEFHKKWETEKGKTNNSSFSTSLIQHLANQFVNDSGSFEEHAELTRSAMEILLRRKADTGCLVLLADGLDQIADRSQLLSEFENQNNSLVQKIRLVVAGRSNAIQMQWSSVFESDSWTFIRVEPFTIPQQKRYLGSRYDRIPESARELLFIPRVLEYLLKTNNYENLHTAADVYAAAIQSMIQEGLEGLDKVKYRDVSCELIFELLSRQAFQSFYRQLKKPLLTFQKGTPSQADAQPPEYRYNISEFQSPSTYAEFRESIRRVSFSKLQGSFDPCWDAIQGINQFLDYGIFDQQPTSGVLNRLFWANRSLHEFLLAYYFANYATEKESTYLWDWIYLPDQDATDQYYPFWQFLCEMPLAHSNPLVWLRSIAMLYQPNILAPDRAVDSPNCVYYAKRSNEMIYRSWERLETYVRSNHNADASDLATEIREKWWGEFEQTILTGRLGKDLIAVADAVKRHFLEIPGGKVRLGTTKERREIPELIKAGKKELLDFQRDAANLTKLFDKRSFYRSRAGRVLRSKQTSLFLKLAEQPQSEESIRAYLAERFGYVVGEPQEMPLSAFQLGRQTISNGWYQLYDSRHPNKHSNYSEYSPSPDHPAVALSFYDAWVYSQWLRWDGQSCRLPFEAEWEYAAKIGYPHWALEYWWEDAQDLDKPKHDFSADRIICWETRQNKDSKGMTEIPSAKRASPGSKEADPSGEGLKDMQGNTWEWCMDAWQPNSIGTPPETTINPHPGNASVRRVVRGGCFYVNGLQASASYRILNDPTFASISYGLRLARAPDRKS